MKRPVLLLGWIPRIILPIARSLQKNGVPVDVADFAFQYRIRSRALREFRRIRRPDLDRTEFVDQLSRFIRERGHDMLIPTDDQTLAALTEHYDDFKDMLHIACPAPPIARLVLKKSSCLEIAQQCGIRVPKTVVVSNSAQLLDLARSFPFPWILKPAEKETRIEETKVFSLANVDEVALKFPAAQEFAPPMLLQEYCPGMGVGVEMLVHQGECLAVFQHRRLKEWPYTGGVSVTAVAEHPHPTLVESSLDLLRALRWEGVAMVEFRIDPASGTAVLMEVNGRYWGTLSLPISAGIDFPLYHWQVAHGEKPNVPKTCDVGAKWRWTVGCQIRLYSLLASARSSDLARKELRTQLLQIPEDFGPRVRDATFTFTDPIPSLVLFFRAMREFAVLSAKVLVKSLFRKSRAVRGSQSSVTELR